ncbi:unnamed protein product [Citrullus colocynthis]|uniref:Uncharacterized protein n=1 Tax=Citrullus colocynthis TaxID=252529 RepID=A0ABP0YHP8_9ROSI
MSAMSYNGSNCIGLLMLNANSYNYPMAEFGFTSQHQSDGDPIGDNPEGEQTYYSYYGWLSSELDSTDLFDCQDPYGNRNGCRMENTELTLLQNEDQVEDYNGDSRNLYYEFTWDCFQLWFGFGEDEQGQDWNGQELKPENDCNSDALALLEAVLGY